MKYFHSEKITFLNYTAVTLLILALFFSYFCVSIVTSSAHNVHTDMAESFHVNQPVTQECCHEDTHKAEHEFLKATPNYNYGINNIPLAYLYFDNSFKINGGTDLSLFNYQKIPPNSLSQSKLVLLC